MCCQIGKVEICLPADIVLRALLTKCFVSELVGVISDIIEEVVLLEVDMTALAIILPRLNCVEKQHKSL